MIYLVYHTDTVSYLELGLELLHEADAGAGVRGDVNARQAELAGVLRGGEEELILSPV